ncbi:MAG: type II toxin-antitoxin system VapC family toxin, partial [Longimicrobiales bacterium]
ARPTPRYRVVKYLIDTMVLSEAARPTPAASVVEWLRAQVSLDVAVSVLTFGEIERGVARMVQGRRKTELERWLGSELRDYFGERVLPVDLEVARAWGVLTASSERRGHRLPVVDGLLLATARVHGLTIVTRNVDDFAGHDVPVHNPYAP